MPLDDDNLRRNTLLFWTLCIPLRLGIGIASLALGFILKASALPYAAIATLCVTAGFTAKAFQNPDLGGLGGRLWWKKARKVHILCWGTTTALLALSVRWAGAFLVVDALLGALFGYMHYFLGVDDM